MGSFSPLPFTSLLFMSICKDSSDNHFAFFAFLFLGDGLDQCLVHDWETELNRHKYSVTPHCFRGSSHFRGDVVPVCFSVQLLSRVWLFATPWAAAHQASMSITNSRSLPKLMSIELVMPSNHLILCHPLLLLPSIFPSIRIFSNESFLHIRWPEYWSFSFNISPSIEHSGLISFRMDWIDLLAVQGTLKSLLQHRSSKASILQCSTFFIVQLSHPYRILGKPESWLDGPLLYVFKLLQFFSLLFLSPFPWLSQSCSWGLPQFSLIYVIPQIRTHPLCLYTKDTPLTQCNWIKRYLFKFIDASRELLHRWESREHGAPFPGTCDLPATGPLESLPSTSLLDHSLLLCVYSLLASYLESPPIF